MAYFRALLSLVLGFVALAVQAQKFEPTYNTYNIADPGKKFEERCGEIMQVFNSMPVDIKFDIYIHNKNELWFRLSDTAYVRKFFTSSNDGIAVDIKAAKQFRCKGEHNMAQSLYHEGILLKPVYFKTMLKVGEWRDDGEFHVKVGELPEGLRATHPLEFNILFLKKTYWCYTNVQYKIPAVKWDLLDMGLFMDTLEEKDSQMQTLLLKKYLKFMVPFEQDKYDYKAEDVRPIYDSLLLNRFDIKSLKIRAYASIEGSTERNAELQKRRAESITEVLQSFQVKHIKYDIATAENWVEFFEDIEGTSFEYLRKLGQDEIKSKVNAGLAKDLEPILTNHRKAILEVTLEKKTTITSNDPEEIRSFFGQAMASGDIRRALEVQSEIFNRINDKQLPERFADSLEIPRQADFGLLLNNKLAHDYHAEHVDEAAAIKGYEDLLKLTGDNAMIWHNLLVLKLRSWRNGNQLEHGKLIADIRKLQEVGGLDRSIGKRLELNYYILLTEYLLQKKDYSAKEEAVQFIYNYFKNQDLDDADVLNAAFYFSAYRKFDLAIDVIKDKVRRVDVDEDLLFYYIMLTISDEELIKSRTYRSILSNAIGQNPKRFCDLFLPNNKGGVTFQLRHNDVLNKSWCQNCRYRR
jgi:hypothetical protein